MKRKDFLQGIGIIGLGAFIPNKANAAAKQKAFVCNPPNCFLTPAVPEGPYYFNTNLIREDITETKTGIPIIYNITVVDINCVPIPNALVDIWQCDKDGIYSAFSSQGTLGQTFLRGAQMTDSNGQVSFKAIYPGWYNGRLTHLHVKIHFNNNTYVTTNFFYTDAVNQLIYSTPLYTKGQNTTTIAKDVELKGDTKRFNDLLMTFTGDTSGIVASYTAGINTTVSAVNEPDPETGGQFVLRQNFPNPFEDISTVKFSLLQSSEVDFSIFDLEGRELFKLLDSQKMGSGEHFIDIHRNSGLYAFAPGVYMYQMKVRNLSGEFAQSKRMIIQ